MYMYASVCIDGSGTDAGTDGSNSGTESNLRQNQTRSYTFLSESHRTPMEGVVYKAGTNQPLSFIPQKSPVKVETVEVSIEYANV